MDIEVTKTKIGEFWDLSNDLVISILAERDVNFRIPSEHSIQSVKHLRISYKQGRAPDFSNPEVRQAYFCAYHPHHLVASILIAKSVGAYVPELTTRRSISAVDIGCGSGAASIGLSSYRIFKNKPSSEAIPPISWTFIDKQQGWLEFLEAQSIKIGGRLVEKSASFIVSDFNRSNNSALAMKSVREASVLVSQAMLTELEPAGVERFISLASQAKRGTPLILSDLDQVGVNGQHFIEAFKTNGGEDLFEEIYQDQLNFRVPRPPKEFLSLLDRSNNRIPKRNCSFGFCLYKRR